MKLQEFIHLCADEDILLKIFDDESGEEVFKPTIWKSDYARILDEYIGLREVCSFCHTKDGYNLIMEIYVK